MKNAANQWAGISMEMAHEECGGGGGGAIELKRAMGIFDGGVARFSYMV